MMEDTGTQTHALICQNNTISVALLLPLASKVETSIGLNAKESKPF